MDTNRSEVHRMDRLISELVVYGQNYNLVHADDKIYVINRLLELFKKSEFQWVDVDARQLDAILSDMNDYAVTHGLIEEDTITNRDLFDTKIMGILTPTPSVVRELFQKKYIESPKEATDFYYQFSQATNYIRKDRVAKDEKWVTESEYGPIDITINLSKPEKDPRDIVKAATQQKSEYPKCLLCQENEGYAGHVSHPARQNHRLIPIQLAEQAYYLQYSPYVYYNEHCIVFNAEHVPMKIDKSAFQKLLDFVRVFPHYFVGSNADLPIVGGSILSHEHFQGGHYTFAMETAPVKEKICFDGFEDIQAGIVKWPMSVIRLRSGDSSRLVELADKILRIWRGYTDEKAGVIAYSDDQPHNTITPIARRRGEDYELDLVLRCNITTPEYPMGVFHPHEEKHHIKKENIGLIEVMGLAVLPSRLKQELTDLAQAAYEGRDISEDEVLEKHAAWLNELKQQYTFTRENALDIILKETGKVFAEVLEDAGVYKNTPEGMDAFLRFISEVN